MSSIVLRAAKGTSVSFDELHADLDAWITE